jgi:hypothetical protein
MDFRQMPLQGFKDDLFGGFAGYAGRRFQAMKRS